MPVAGFISPPNWFDPSPAEFISHCADDIGTQQYTLPLFGFDFALNSISQTEPEQLIGARALGGCSCDVIAMTGTPFGWAGLAGEEEARSRGERLEQAAGVPTVMTGTAIIDAFRAAGISKVALAPTYYAPDWKEAWKSFVSSCGFNVVLCETLEDQGLIAEEDKGSQFGWVMAPELVTASVQTMARNPRGAEAIIVTGAGCRTNQYIAELEQAAGMPVIGSDTAVFWAAAKAANIPLKSGTFGALTDL